MEQQTTGLMYDPRDLERAAMYAAQATLDAHGCGWPAQDVWDFIQNANDESDGELYPEMDRLPQTMPRDFEGIYWREFYSLKARFA